MSWKENCDKTWTQHSKKKDETWQRPERCFFVGGPGRWTKRSTRPILSKQYSKWFGIDKLFWIRKWDYPQYTTIQKSKSMCAVSIPCTYESTRAVPVDTQWEIAHQTYHTLIVHVVATTRILSPSYTYIDCGPCVSHARKRLKKLPRNITRSLNTSKPHPEYCL